MLCKLQAVAEETFEHQTSSTVNIESIFKTVLNMETSYSVIYNSQYSERASVLRCACRDFERKGKYIWVPFFYPEDIRILSPGAVWNLGKGTGLS